jgi:menaquinone-dependent protoporphyrinogen oxidase
MARIVVIFGTTDGQTAKVAHHVTEVLRSEQHLVDLIDTRTPLQWTPLQGVDAAVIAGSVRMGKFQRSLVRFVRAHRDALAKIPTAFLAVSMSAARDTPAAGREVSKTVARFVDETGFQPRTVLPVAGALLYTRYGFFTKLALRFISKMAGGDTDTSRDYEYTDWAALSDLSHRFALRLREAAPSVCPERDGWHADAAI